MNPSDETARDPQGRMLPGHSANPAGRPVRKPYLRLLEAAEAVGATVVVMVPPASPPGRQARPCPTRRPTPPTDTPPRAA
jgi:hypothetical protein